MEKYKYRVIYKENDVMKAFYIDSEGFTLSFELGSPRAYHNDKELHIVAVNSFLGFTDKHGKDVYDNDILEFTMVHCVPDDEVYPANDTVLLSEFDKYTDKSIGIGVISSSNLPIGHFSHSKVFTCTEDDDGEVTWKEDGCVSLLQIRPYHSEVVGNRFQNPDAVSKFEEKVKMKYF